MDVIILSQCKKEIDRFPLSTKEALLDAISDLQAGVILAMPLSKKLESSGGKLFELRFRERFGAYRVIYYIKKNDAIYLVHAFQKKTQKTPKSSIELAQQRIKRFI